MINQSSPVALSVSDLPLLSHLLRIRALTSATAAGLGRWLGTLIEGIIELVFNLGFDGRNRTDKGSKGFTKEEWADRSNCWFRLDCSEYCSALGIVACASSSTLASGIGQ